MIDTHCHLTFKEFSGREREIMDRAADAGVGGAITVSTSAANVEAGLELAHADDRVWCTAGVHPLYADQPLDWDRIRRVAADPRCVAWGELGLDHHYDRPPRDLQVSVLEAQLSMIEAARRESPDTHDLPIVVHCRRAVDTLLPILSSTSLPPERFVFHCFTETPDDAQRVLDFGAWISFTGVVTFQNAKEVAEAAKLVPEDRIMVETDAPYLTPAPHRKVFPNEPCHVVHTAHRLAELRGVDPDDFALTLDRNAARFFSIELPNTHG